MCSKFEGDLADIIRGSGGGGNGNTMMASTTEEPVVDPTWQFPSNAMGRRLDGFGDPFPNMQDPLLQDLDTPISPPPFFTTTTNNNITSHISINESNVTNSIFSSMGYEMTCSSVDKLQSGTSIVVASGDMINNNNSGTSNDRHHVMETQVLQISSPRNTGIKRRKSQAKKVVCIPAPAPVNSSRQSGEVVPSDLWAWRKYGQKPIKGSPYPRGYYRCSSSKGCSARKQVERSRTDPNMLVITYTCEHNHPWPTQRNALAGSTRSSPHTSKNTSSSSSSSALHTSPSSSSFSHPNPIHNTNTTTATTTTNTIPKDENEGKKESNSITSSHECGNVKEEETVIIMEQRAEMETHIPPAFATQTYRPTLPDESNYYNHSEDFFAELGEIEADPLNLLFENNEENNNNNNNKQSDAALDPFGFYDWAAENNNDSGGLLLGGEETKGGVQQNP